MRRRSLLLFAVLSLFACKRDGGGAKATSAAPAPSAKEGTGGGPRTLLPGATCLLPERFDHDVTIAEGCVADVTESVLVENGATLAMQPGVHLRFHPGTYLEVGHRGSKLVAKGTADKPIVFTSAAKLPSRGDWVGLVLDDTLGESTIEHAVIEYGGQETHGGSGALTAFRTGLASAQGGRVTVRDVVFRDNETAVSHRDDRSLFASFAQNTFARNARSLRISAPVLIGLGDGNRYDDPVDVLGGTIAGQGTWPKANVIIREPVNVNGREKPASLTIARGATLRFAQNTWLEIGTTGPAELVARGVTFTSANDKPKAGDWVGLVFGDQTRHAVVAESYIEYAGAEEHGGDAAVTFVGSKPWQKLDVTFYGIVFRQIAQAHFSSNGDGCDKALDPRRGIGWAGMTEPCR